MLLQYLASRGVLHTRQRRHRLLGVTSQLQLLLSELADNRGMCDVLHTYIHR